jgi:hypothetical protein
MCGNGLGRIQPPLNFNEWEKIERDIDNKEPEKV